MKIISGLLVLAFSLIVIHSVDCQIIDADRYTEAEIAVESKFVEAAQLQLLGRYEEAIVQYEKLVKEDKENSVIHFQLSRCYEATKDNEKAIKSGKLAVELVPENEFYNMQLSEVYEANGQFTEAAKTYLAYSKFNPKEAFFYEKAIYLFIQNKEFDSAILALNKLEKQQGIEESVSRQKFEIFSKQGESKKAIKELSKLAKAFPEKERFSLNLANYYMQLGEMKKAENTIKTLLKRKPDSVTAKEFLSVSKAGSPSKEIDYIRAIAVDIPNKKITIDEKIGKIIPILKKFVVDPDPVISEELIKVSSKLIETYPEEAKAYALHGDVLMSSNKLEEAIDAYNVTISIQSSVFDVWYQLMVAQKDLGRIDDLLMTSEKTLLRFPNQGIAYLFNGYALNKKSKPEEALEILEEAILYSGKDDDLRRNLKIEMARSQFLQDRNDLALTTLNSEEINTADSWELKGDIFNRNGNTVKAVEAWRKALSFDSSNKRITEKISQNQS